MSTLSFQITAAVIPYQSHAINRRPERQEYFGRSLAVGSEEFIRRVQPAMGIRAIGRRVFETPATEYQLKESIAEYGSTNSDRTEEENSAMAVTNAIPWKLEDGLEW